MQFQKLGKIPGALALILITGFFAMFFTVLFVPQPMPPVVVKMVDIIGSILLIATGYHFGKSDE